MAKISAGAGHDSADQARSLLAARLKDMEIQAEKRPVFMGFLDEASAAEASRMLARQRHLLWGGFETAERKYLGVFPSFVEPDLSLFPIRSVAVMFREAYCLTHRDFLGALMALGIQRETVGDILVEPGRAMIFVREQLADYLKEHMRKVGSVGVRIELDEMPEMHYERRFESLQGVLASERLDCIVAFLGRLSRDKAAALIKSGQVQVNHMEVHVLSEKLMQGDVISIRKKGKYILDEIGTKTAKGRLRMTFRRYL